MNTATGNHDSADEEYSTADLQEDMDIYDGRAN